MSGDLLSDLLDQLTGVLASLAAAGEDPWLLERFLQPLDATDSRLSGGLVDGLKGIAQSVDAFGAALSGSPSLQSIVGALQGIRGLVASVRSLSQGSGSNYEQLGEDLLNLAALTWLRQTSPLAYQIAVTLGVVEYQSLPQIKIGDEVVRIPMPVERLVFDRIGTLFTNPLALIKEQLPSPALSTAANANQTADTIVGRVGGLLNALGIAWSYGYPLEHEKFLGNVAPLAAHTLALYLPTSIVGDDVTAGVCINLSSADADDLGIILTPVGALTLQANVGRWALSLELAADVQALAFGGGKGFKLLASAGSTEVHALAKAAISAPPADSTASGLTSPGAMPGSNGTPSAPPSAIIGSADGSRLEFGSPELTANLDATVHSVDAGFSAGTGTSALIIHPSDTDSFLSSLLPSQGARLNFDFGVAWSRSRGLRWQGGAGMDVILPVGLRLGSTSFGLTLVSVELDLKAADTTASLDISATVSASLGPVQATVAGMGVGATLSFPNSGGSLAVADLDLGFKPPSGVGLGVAAGPITGGGFIGYDPDSGRYSGVFELQAEQVGISALGLIDTKLPGGRPGYALLIVLQATFPGVQLGLGFALTGVGGLIGLNRRVDVDTLRARLAAGTAGRVLAPQDPIANAPALLADLDAVFPVAAGLTVVGPTVQLVWAGLVHFDVGVFIELPGPARVVLLGSAHAEIQRDGASYLKIRVDVLGDIDIPAGKVSFDAVLVDSHLMGTLDLTGGAAFRFCAGGQPYSVLTLGGFNPAYNPEPLTFPASLTRIAMVHGTPHDELYLRFEGYFAVTSNSYQYGAAVEALIHSGGFTVHGTLGYDALIQFVPFHFEVDLRAAVDVAYHGHTLAGLTLTGALSGPGPVVLKAKVCIELLFFDICFSHTFQLGPSTPPPEPAPADLLATLLAELTDPARLRADGTDPNVQLNPPDPTAAVPVVIPTGALIWQQHKAPLGLLLDRVGGTPLPAAAQVQASVATAATATTDWFAPGQFLDLTDDQTMTRPGYELLSNGLQLAGGPATDGPAAQASLTITEIRLPSAPARPPTHVTAFPIWLLTQPPRTASPLVAVSPQAWTLTGPAGVISGLSAAQALRRADLTPAAHAVPGIDHDHPLAMTF